MQVQIVISPELSLKGMTEFEEAREVEGAVDSSKAGSQDESLVQNTALCKQ